MHSHEIVRYVQRSNHQIMLVLISGWDNRIYALRVCIKKLVVVAFIFDLKLLYNFLCFVPYEDVQQNKMIKIINLFKYSLRFISYLNLLILKKWIFLPKIANFKASRALLLLKTKQC